MLKKRLKVVFPRSVEVAKASREGLPEKIWMKVFLSSFCFTAVIGGLFF
jgi:hypothetical protein